MQYRSISVDTMIEVDRMTVEHFGVSLPQMMENAGRSSAALARRKLGGDVGDRKIAVLAGHGNNGGGGLVAARHLANAGARVEVIIAATQSDFQTVPHHQLRVLQLMEVAIHHSYDAEASRVISSRELLIDALLGYSLQGEPKEPHATLIRQANQADAVRVSLDVPAGLESNTGASHDPTIDADATLTLAWPKMGMLTHQAHPFTGELWLADIGIPGAVMRRLGLEPGHLFSRGPLVRVSRIGDAAWAPDMTPG